MMNRHFYILILLIQISAVWLILRKTPTKKTVTCCIIGIFKVQSDLGILVYSISNFNKILCVTIIMQHLCGKKSKKQSEKLKIG